MDRVESFIASPPASREPLAHEPRRPRLGATDAFSRRPLFASRPLTELILKGSKGRKVSLPGSSWGRSGVRAIAAVRSALMLVAQAAQRQRGGSGEAIIATRFRAALSAMQATVLSLYFLILSRVLR
jgi:hypothetical protein